MNVTAKVTRSGEWWAVEVPEVPGVFTQVKRLDQVEAQVRDAVALMEDVPEADVEVEVVPVLEPELALRLAVAKGHRAEADRLSAMASVGTRNVATMLAKQGLPMRDVGVVLGVSHQRVAQLLEQAQADAAATAQEWVDIAIAAARHGEIGAPPVVVGSEQAPVKGATRTTVTESTPRKGKSRSASSGRFDRQAKAARYSKTTAKAKKV